MKTRLVLLLFFVPILQGMAQWPVVTSEALKESGAEQRRDLSIPGSRIVINPYDFSQDAQQVSALQYSAGREIPLHLGYLSTQNQYTEKQQMGRALKQVLTCWLRDRRSLRPADTVSYAWTPHALPFRAGYGAQLSLDGYDFFYNEEVLVRHLSANRQEAFTMAGLVPESMEVDRGQSALVVRSLNSQYAIVFSRPFKKVRYYRTQADMEARRNAQSSPGKGGWWAIDFSPFQTMETGIALGAPGRQGGELVTMALQALQPGAVGKAYAQRQLYWDHFLASQVPHPDNFSFSVIDPKGVSPEEVRLSYYKAWVCLAQNVLSPDPQAYPYYQVVAGKASLWAEGEPAAPFSATWESLIGLQLYALIDPAISWSALKGLLSLVDQEGMLGGESLPSRKAQSAWLLYQYTLDRSSLQSVYPALKRYMNWRRVHPRWIYKDATPENEKDAEFVVSALMDMKAMARIAAVLELPADKSWWEKEEAALFNEYTHWFWSSPQALPVQHINQRKGRDSYPVQITSGLSLDQLKGPYLQTMLQLFNEHFDTSRSFAGFDAPKYPDMDYTIYGLIRNGQTRQAQILVEANIRDVIRSGSFAETYFHKGRPVPGGVRPSIFGMAQVISFVMLKNGYVFDKGDPYVNGLFREAGTVKGIHYQGRLLDIGLEAGGRQAWIRDSGRVQTIPVDSTSIRPVSGWSLSDSIAWYMQQSRQEQWYARALANAGDETRIQKVMQKAMAGDTITIGVIGGSITAGAAASDFGATAYAPLVADWWRKTFPHATIRFINAGIGATNSVYGVHRVDRELLQYHPDFVIVEFSVNDRDEPEAQESYEGLLRKILRSPQEPGLLTVGLMDEKGTNWQAKHLPVSRHYGLTYLSYRDAIWPEIEKGAINWRELSPDEVHPNDRGHAYIAGFITAYLDSVRLHLDSRPVMAGSQSLPAPLTKNSYENAYLLLPAEVRPLSLGAFELKKEGWQASTKGAPLVVELEAGTVWVNYFRTNKGNGGKADVYVDGRLVQQLDADFAGGWGDYIQATLLIKTDKPGRHRISFHCREEGKSFLIRNILVSKY